MLFYDESQVNEEQQPREFLGVKVTQGNRLEC